MNSKGLIIIGVIILLCVGAGAYFLFSATPEYKNITMNGITIEVPASNNNVTNQTEHYSIYNDTKNDILIIVFDSENSGLSDMSEATTFAAIRETFQVGSQLQQESNQEFNHSEALNVYTYLTNYGHKNLFIVTKNKEDMKNILSSIDVDSITIELNNTENETTNITTTSTEKSSKSSSKSDEREEDKITPDGWNPKEHEVYRESLDADNEKVHYDDGYFRIVNKKGDVITYGYGH